MIALGHVRSPSQTIRRVTAVETGDRFRFGVMIGRGTRCQVGDVGV